MSKNESETSTRLQPLVGPDSSLNESKSVSDDLLKRKKEYDEKHKFCMSNEKFPMATFVHKDAILGTYTTPINSFELINEYFWRGYTDLFIRAAKRAYDDDRLVCVNDEPSLGPPT